MTENVTESPKYEIHLYANNGERLMAWSSYSPHIENDTGVIRFKDYRNREVNIYGGIVVSSNPLY